MSSVRRRLILPVETQSRELDAKLLLACFAAERGFSVVVGSKKEIHRRIGALPRSIFVSKSLTRRNIRFYGILRMLGHPLVCGDEESLVYPSAESYLTLKVDDRALRHAQALLAWGPENARVWREYPGYHGVPIHVTGNPRFDLLRPELRAFFEREARALREVHGPFLLVNTNFARLNHYYPHLSWQRLLVEGSPAAPAGAGEADVGLARHRHALFEHFLEMLPAVARTFPDRTVVVRPHPSENQETWRLAAAACPNVRVVHEGSAIPWLLASDALIHNGCTTGLEATLLDRIAVAYQPVTSERFDLHLPNGVSHQAFDLEGLLERLARALDGRLEADAALADARRKLIERHVTAASGRFAAERIVSALEEFAEGHDAFRLPGLRSVAEGRLRAAWRRARKSVESRRPGDRNSREYLLHMFPGVSLDEVRARVARFGALLGRFSDVETRLLFENVFLVESR